MPLSEEELRLLEQMERALAAEDPKFVSTLRGGAATRAARHRLIGAIVGFVVGLAMLMGGAMTAHMWVGVLGFVVMLGAAMIGLAASRHRGDTGTGAQPGPAGPSGRFGVVEGGRSDRRPRRSPKHGTFMQRMEERWERRRNQGF